MTKRPLCMVCLVLMLLMCVADRAGFPLIRGNPVPEMWTPGSGNIPRSQSAEK